MHAHQYNDKCTHTCNRIKQQHQIERKNDFLTHLHMHKHQHKQHPLNKHTYNIRLFLVVISLLLFLLLLFDV